MKTILSYLLFFLIFNQSLNAMMDEEGEFFPISSVITRKEEQETLVKDIAELKLQKAQLEQEIENMKKQISQYTIEIKALAAIRRIRQNQQEDEASSLLAKAITRSHFNEKPER